MSIIQRNDEQIIKVFKAVLFDFKKQPHEHYHQLIHFVPRDVANDLTASLINDRLQNCNNYNELTRSLQFCYDCVNAAQSTVVALNQSNSQQILECLT